MTSQVPRFCPRERTGFFFVHFRRLSRCAPAYPLVNVVVLKNGKLSRGDELAKIFAKYIN